MFEPKINLIMVVPGASLMSSQECEKNPKINYDIYKLLVISTKGKGKHQKPVKELLTYKVRKQKTISHKITMCKEAYEYMLSTPPSIKLKKVWNIMNDDQKLRSYFDNIAHDFHAINYSYQILDE